MTHVTRRGVIKVMHKRTGAVIQEELNGSLRIFKQAEWAFELRKRAKMSEAKWNEYAGFTSEEIEEEKENQMVAGADTKVAGAPKKKASGGTKKGRGSSQKPIVEKKEGGTLIEDDKEDGDEIHAS